MVDLWIHRQRRKGVGELSLGVEKLRFGQRNEMWFNESQKGWVNIEIGIYGQNKLSN